MSRPTHRRWPDSLGAQRRGIPAFVLRDQDQQLLVQKVERDLVDAGRRRVVEAPGDLGGGIQRRIDDVSAPLVEPLPLRGREPGLGAVQEPLGSAARHRDTRLPVADALLRGTEMKGELQDAHPLAVTQRQDRSRCPVHAGPSDGFARVKPTAVLPHLSVVSPVGPVSADAS